MATPQMLLPPIQAPKNEFDAPIMILTTVGRYSGNKEAAILHYRMEGGDFVLVARMKQGHYKPDWYLNLKEEPFVEIEVNGKSFSALANTPTGTERLRLWQVANDLAPDDTWLQVPREAAIVTLAKL